MIADIVLPLAMICCIIALLIQSNQFLEKSRKREMELREEVERLRLLLKLRQP